MHKWCLIRVIVACTHHLVQATGEINHFQRIVRQPLLFDGRNLFDPELVRSAGLEYFGIGRR